MIPPILIPLWGPFAIHAYGFFIALGVGLATGCFMRDRIASRMLSQDQMVAWVYAMCLGGFLGGRIVEIFTEHSFFEDPWYLMRFWEPGLSVLGAILGICITLLWFLWFYNIKNRIVLLDRVAIYAPLVQIFGRIGCFFAGCCYGIPTSKWYGVVYTNAHHLAPLHCSLHPVQLYSAGLLSVLFFYLYAMRNRTDVRVGFFAFSYLFFVGVERFLLDFFRWDRLYIDNLFGVSFSVHQCIAISISLGVLILYVLTKKRSVHYGSI